MRLLTFGLILTLAAQTGDAQSSKWSIWEGQEGVLLMDGADSILFYQCKPKSLQGKFQRSNYIHPLYGISGTVLTEDFPEDHLHHRGIFWAWHQIYIGHKSMGDAWALEDFSWDVKKISVSEHPDSCIITASVDWKSPRWLNGQSVEKRLATETVIIKVFSRIDNYRLIDFSIEIEALEDSLSIGGSEDEMGYGGFSWRMVLPADIRFSAENGTVEPQNLALQAGPWMNIGGEMNGTGTCEGIVVISHHTNPDQPQAWILRKKRSMQNVVYPGKNRVQIRKGEPLLLRYRMVVYEGALSASQIATFSKY